MMKPATMLKMLYFLKTTSEYVPKFSRISTHIPYSAMLVRCAYAVAKPHLPLNASCNINNQLSLGLKP